MLAAHAPQEAGRAGIASMRIFAPLNAGTVGIWAVPIDG
jgi:hypothetical protein